MFLSTWWTTSIFLMIVSLTVSGGQAADSWPQFRGPDGQGQAPQADVPIHFSSSESFKWQTPIEGRGWSSPVVADGRVWLTTAVTRDATEQERQQKLAGDPMAKIKEVAGAVELKAICVDFATGQQLHSISLANFDDPEPINPLNTYASPTAVIDDGRVYCHFGNYGTWCLDASNGQVIWQERLQVDHSVGPGSSPFIHGNQLILVCDGIDQQFVAALNKLNGKELWRTARPPMRAGNVEFKKAYSTPVAVQVDGKTQIVVPTAQWICGYEPDTGAEIWRIDHGDGFSLSASPVVAEGLVIFSTGFMRPELVAVRPNGHGDATKSHVAWRVSRGVPEKPSPIIVGDKLYMISDSGVLTQLRVSDGSIVWQERISGNFSASPIYAGGRLYFCSQEGDVTVVAPGDEYRQLAKNQLQPRLMASPAVVGNDLLIRTEQNLVRIGN